MDHGYVFSSCWLCAFGDWCLLHFYKGQQDLLLEFFEQVILFACLWKGSKDCSLGRLYDFSVNTLECFETSRLATRLNTSVVLQ